MNKITKNTMICPICNANWDQGLIVDNFIRRREKGDEFWKGMTDEEIEKIVHRDYSPPYRFSRLIAITDMCLDKVTSFMCPDCHSLWDTETGQKR